MPEHHTPGDSNAITRAYMDSILIEMRHLGAVLPDTRFSLFGESFSTPVMTAALSHLKGRTCSGMAEMAAGCAAAGAVCWAGMGDEGELEEMLATGARVVKIIKPYEDNDSILVKIRHAARHGALAVGMDMDHAFDGRGQHDVVLGEIMSGKTMQELRGFVQASGLPFIFKGVLSARDAEIALELGAAGIVVSHHHGIMPWAVPPLRVLPEIVRAVKGRLKIFADCGISSGYDVFKALALGADAACAGRVIIGPLQEKGLDGVREEISRMTGELAGAMARTACGTLADISADLLWLPRR